MYDDRRHHLMRFPLQSALAYPVKPVQLCNSLEKKVGILVRVIDHSMLENTQSMVYHLLKNKYLSTFFWFITLKRIE